MEEPQETLDEILARHDDKTIYKRIQYGSFLLFTEDGKFEIRFNNCFHLSDSLEDFIIECIEKGWPISFRHLEEASDSVLVTENGERRMFERIENEE